MTQDILACLQRVEQKLDRLLGDTSGPDPDRRYTPREAADVLGVARSTVYGLIAEGKLSRCATGTAKVLVTGAELRRFLSTQAQA